MIVRKILSMLFVFLALLQTSGCGRSYLYTGIRQDFEKGRVKRIAVLPFLNETNRRSAGEIVTNIFILGVLQARLFKVEERGNVEQFLYQEKIRDVSRIRKRELRRLGERLNIDAVYIGTVEEYTGGAKGTRLATPKIAFRVKLVETKTGTVLWAAHNRASGDDYVKIFDVGRIRTVENLTKRLVIKTLMSTFQEDEKSHDP